MTWWDIYSQAKAETGNVVPEAKLTPMLGLAWASEAQAILQSETNCVRKCEEILLNGSDFYPLLCKVKVVDSIRYTPTVPSSNMPLAEVTPDQFFDIVANWGTDVTVSIDKLYWTIEGNKLSTYPPTVTGTLDIKYKPYLSIYSPSNTEEWRKFGKDPAAQMQLRGPEQEMTPGLSGILAFTKARMIMQTTDSRYEKTIEFLMGQFEQAKKYVAKDNVQYSTRTVPRPTLNGTF